MNKNYVFVILLLFALPTVFAVPQGVGVLRNGQISAVMADVNCKSTFNVGVLQSYITAIPSASANLSSLIDKINADTQVLSGYANNNDTSSFREYLRGTYETDSKNVKSQLNAIRRGANLSNETRSTLRSEYEALKATYDSCHVESVRSFANSKVEAYENHLREFENRTDDLENKGVDVSSMRSLINRARSELINPLRSAINEGDTPKLVRSASRQYCMFDGCGNGTDFHFAAKFEIEKLTNLLNKIKETNTSANISQKVTQAENYLNLAESELNSLNDTQYGDESKSEVWGNIKNAANEIKDILKDVRSERSEDRKEAIRQRVNEIRNETRDRVEEIRNRTWERRNETHSQENETENDDSRMRNQTNAMENETSSQGRSNQTQSNESEDNQSDDSRSGNSGRGSDSNGQRGSEDD